MNNTFYFDDIDPESQYIEWARCVHEDKFCQPNDDWLTFLTNEVAEYYAFLANMRKKMLGDTSSS